MIYVYANEVYPTVVRSTGSSCTLAAGRVGSILGPIVYEGLASSTGGYDFFFWIMTITCIVNLALIFFLPFETAGKVLQDHLEPPVDEKYGAADSARDPA